jgi:hypothetical protein
MSNLLEKASILLTPTAYDDGKILSVKPSIVLGEELVTNGDFATDSDWILRNNTTISGGKLINSNSFAYSSTSQSIPMSVGTYLFTYTIDSISGGGFFIAFTGFNGITRYAAGTYSEYVTLSSASTSIFLAPVSSGMTYTIDNVSVKEVLDADFDFTRNSSATRVNSQGLIEDMQILSGDLVSNGDFSQEGPELLSQPVNIVTDFLPNGGGVIVDADTFETFGGTFDGIRKNSFLTIGKTYRLTIEGNTTSSGFSIGEVTASGNEYGSGFGTFYFTAVGTGSLWVRQNTSGTTNITSFSVKEVGQDWNFGGGWSMGNGVAESDSTPASYLGQEGVILTTNPYELTFQARLKSGTNGTVTALIGGSNSNQFTIEDTNWQTFKYKNTRLPSTQTGIYFNNDGNEIEITNVSVVEITDDTNLPRIDYSPYSGAGTCGHWLFEPQSTNLFTESENFSNGDWTLYGGASITPNNAVSPQGTQNASKLNDVGGIYDQRPYNPNTNYIFSVFAKTDTSTSITINFVDQAAGYLGGTIKYTFATNVASVILQSANGSVVAEKEDYGNGWIRVILKFTTNSAQNYNYQSIEFQGGDGWIWGAQLEQQSYATSYIPTEGSIKTRLADAAFGAGSSDLINSTEGVLYAEIKGFVNDALSRPISISDGTTSNRINLFFPASQTQVVGRVSSGGVTVADMIYTGINQSLFNKIAVKYKENDFALWVNGVEVLTDTSGAAPIGLEELAFDNAAGTKFHGKAKCVAVFKEALTDDELECLTSDETSYSSFTALALANNYTII